MDKIGRSLHTVWTIFKHEFSLYFVSPMVYLIGSLWLFIAGVFFALSLSFMMSQGGEPSMQNVFGSMVFLMVFIAPALTMRLMSDEIRSGTHELLQTAPIRDWEIVVGKWLAVWAVFSTFMLVTLLFVLLLVLRGNPDMALVFTNYLSLWLMAGATLAIGLLASTLTQFQLVAFMVSMSSILFLWMASWLTQFQFITQQFILDFMSALAIQNHYNNMLSNPSIRPADLAYFFGLIAICLFIATQILNSRRWRA